MATDLAALENLFLGLADKTRLRLLGLMAAGPVSVGNLVAETGDSQPKISRHLAYLRNAGLVETTRQGKWIYYGLAELGDQKTDSVFKCVVDELSDGPAPKRAQRKSRPEPRPEFTDRSTQSAPVEFDRHVENPPENADQEMEWTHPSEDRGSDLDIFLL